MSSLRKAVEVKGPGHALDTPGHTPVTTASTTPGHAPVDATLAEPKPKKIRTLSIDADIDDTIWEKTVERNAATKVGKDDFSTMEGIEKLLDEHIQDFMKILGGDWPDMPKEITVATVCTGSAQDTLTLVAFQRAFAKRKMQGIKFRYLYNCENAGALRRQWKNSVHKFFEDDLNPPGPAGVDASCLPCNFEDMTELWRGTAKCRTHKNGKSPGMCPVPRCDILICSSESGNANPQVKQPGISAIKGGKRWGGKMWGGVQSNVSQLVQSCEGT